VSRDVVAIKGESLVASVAFRRHDKVSCAASPSLTPHSTLS
jgi:hypothetical protein